jgi:hypothetical protein
MKKYMEICTVPLSKKLIAYVRNIDEANSGKECRSKYNNVMICRHLIVKAGRHTLLYILAT